MQIIGNGFQKHNNRMMWDTTSVAGGSDVDARESQHVLDRIQHVFLKTLRALSGVSRKHKFLVVKHNWHQKFWGKAYAMERRDIPKGGSTA